MISITLFVKTVITQRLFQISSNKPSGRIHNMSCCCVRAGLSYHRWRKGGKFPERSGCWKGWKILSLDAFRLRRQDGQTLIPSFLQLGWSRTQLEGKAPESNTSKGSENMLYTRATSRGKHMLRYMNHLYIDFYLFDTAE